MVGSDTVAWVSRYHKRQLVSSAVRSGSANEIQLNPHQHSWEITYNPCTGTQISTAMGHCRVGQKSKPVVTGYSTNRTKTCQWT